MSTEVADRRQANANDSFRRHAALEILKTLLLDDKMVRVLAERYIVERRPTRLARELADELIEELNLTN